MIDPTPEQTEAAAKAMCEAEYPNIPESWAHFSDGGGQDAWRNRARAALVAAAGAAPQEPSGDRVMQIAAHLAQMHTFTLSDGEAIARAALKLAAPVQVDEAKLASLLQEHRPSQWRSFANDTIVYRCCGQDFGRLTGKPRKADRDPRELWEEHMASKLADSLRGDGQ